MQCYPPILGPDCLVVLVMNVCKLGVFQSVFEIFLLPLSVGRSKCGAHCWGTAGRSDETVTEAAPDEYRP